MLPLLAKTAAEIAFGQPRRPAIALFTRKYSVTRENAESRVLDVVKTFEGVNREKVTPNSHFINDLGLDSLVTVELVMAIEEEFSVEIPDDVTDSIQSVRQAVDYLAQRDDAE